MRGARVGSAIVLSVLAVALSTPGSELAEAVEDFEFGEHAAAVEKLEALLGPPMQLSARADVVQARAYLGAGQALMGRESEARSTFSLLLAIAPEHQLDRAVFPPSVVKLFAEVRTASGLDALPTPPEPDEVEPEPPPPPPPALPTVTRETMVEGHSPVLAFVPLGVGQFANGHPVKGALFAASEVGLFGAALASFMAFEGLKSPDGTFGEADVGSAETLQTVYLTTFWVGVGVTALGIVEALVSHPGEDTHPVEVAGPGRVGLRF